MMEVDPKNTFLFSDPHFDHTNIIRYCRRPFRDVEQMNDVILENYNRLVKEDSLVFFLGDMTLNKGSRSWCFWFSQLKGCIIYLKGNHDKRGFRELVIHVGSLYFKLVHDPYDRGDWSGWLIHGHKHDKWPFIDYGRKIVSVSVDVTGFKPVRLSDIVKRIKDLEVR